MKIDRKKLLVLAGISLFVTTNMFAGDNEKGIEYYRAELYEAAKLFFLQQTNQTPLEQAENYYYLGQTYYQLNQVDSAAYYYRKATEVLPEYPFGYIGQGGLELKKGNVKAAEPFFKKANGYAKKDPSVQTAIAEAYIEIGDNNNAVIELDKARKVNSKHSGIYVAEGDMLMNQGKVGDASGSYHNALLFNSADKIAYLKLARIYKNINTNLTLDYLDKLVALDPDYIPAYALIGDINREKGIYSRAVNAYEKFIAIRGVPLIQHERYVYSLFFNKQYDKALDQIKYVISQDPNNLVMKRIEAYNNFRLENYDLGFEQINKFLEAMPKERHIYMDYTTLGQLAVKVKQPEAALDAFNKAVELDSTSAVDDKLHREMAAIAYNASMYLVAITYFDKYFAVATSPDASDYYPYGEANWRAAVNYISSENAASVTSPEEEAAFGAALKNYIQKGDSAYVEVIKRRPNMDIGYLGRAKINYILDVYEQNKTGKTEGHAKPFWEEALTVLLANNEDGSKNKNIIEAYRYMISYYGVNNIAAMIEYSKKILDLDPNDEAVKANLALIRKYCNDVLQADPDNRQAKANLQLLNSIKLK